MGGAMTGDKKRWSDLTSRQRALVVLLGAVELVLTTIAARDLRSRPKEQVRGPKMLWGLVLPVQPFGPVGYLLLGRRR